MSLAVRELVLRQAAEHGIVVWYDSEEHYLGLLPALEAPDCPVLAYDGSILALRWAAETWLSWERQQRPKLLVYVPCAPGELKNGLVELEKAGVTVFPGASQVSRNSRLSVVARRVLKGARGEAAADQIEGQVEAGKLSLADLDRMAGEAQAVHPTLSFIFRSSDPAEIAVRFLSSDRYDDALAEKGALPALDALLKDVYDAEVSPAQDPAELRGSFARHVLLTDLIVGLHDGLPAGLEGRAARSAPAREACVRLAAQWRGRGEVHELYEGPAADIEGELDAEGFSYTQLVRVQGFRLTEALLQKMVARELTEALRTELAEVARQRQAGYWSIHDPEIQTRWAFLAAAAELLMEAARVEAALKEGLLAPSKLIEAYAMGDRPWCLLDTAHRHLERLWGALDLAEDETELAQLMARARQRHTEVAGTLAEQFSRTLADIGFKPPGLRPQREVFATAVRPALAEGKVAYVLVDALRYEMARELFAGLRDQFDGELTPCLGTLPAITEVGMAALLPGAEADAALVPAGPGRVGLQMDDAVLKDRSSRMDFLRDRAGVELLVTWLHDWLPPSRALKAKAEAASLIVVTSQEIDTLGEAGNALLARAAMDMALQYLQRAFRQLAECGVGTIVVAADHGFLFGEPLESDMKIDPPGGETVDLHRRVWVGRGGDASPAYLRLTAADWGLGGDLEVAVPWGFGCFKAPGGGTAYFHGGLSPQEILIPVAVLKPKQAAPSAADQIEWEVRPGSKRIATRFFSVTVRARLAGLFDVALPRVRVDISVGSKSISRPVAASYGFDEATGAVELQMSAGAEREIDPNTVTLIVEPDEAKGTAMIRLMDVRTNRPLTRGISIDLDIGI